RDVTFDESAILKKVTQEKTIDSPQQVESTPKQVEFERMMDSPVRRTRSETPLTEDESDEDVVPTQELL
ncbi:hypothetical protein, partial [Proteus mirabilis]|uniref:hypothetical protein n=1 Tax=Proteus mirabilis TaxID=584 RepID=UPI001C12E180